MDTAKTQAQRAAGGDEIRGNGRFPGAVRRFDWHELFSREWIAIIEKVPHGRNSFRLQQAVPLVANSQQAADYLMLLVFSGEQSP